MSKLINAKMIYPLIAVVLVITLFLLYKKLGRQKSVRVCRYQGYFEAIYDGTKRVSDYLTLANGTRLAYDLILPTKKGVAASEPLPVLLKYTPYLRTFTIFDKDQKNLNTFFVDLKWYEKATPHIRYWLSDRGRLIGCL